METGNFKVSIGKRNEISSLKVENLSRGDLKLCRNLCLCADTKFNLTSELKLKGKR